MHKAVHLNEISYEKGVEVDTGQIYIRVNPAGQEHSQKNDPTRRFCNNRTRLEHWQTTTCSAADIHKTVQRAVEASEEYQIKEEDPTIAQNMLTEDAVVARAQNDGGRARISKTPNGISGEIEHFMHGPATVSDAIVSIARRAQSLGVSSNFLSGYTEYGEARERKTFKALRVSPRVPTWWHEAKQRRVGNKYLLAVTQLGPSDRRVITISGFPTIVLGRRKGKNAKKK
ncbi:hypothetical protein B0H19DRAFT_1066829 [Mycena capillaripes]|nr:hypothetical protein B0H19DRAFT_1066829 [Mycena capillaripes]